MSTNEKPETANGQESNAEQQPNTSSLTPEVAQAELEKARKDAARYRQERKELRERLDAIEAERKAEEQKRLEEAPLQERLQALETEREELAKKAEAAEAARVEAQRLASLTGKVADAKAALRLVEAEHLTEDGGVDTDALLASYPFLAPARERKSAPSAAASPDGTGRAYTLDDLRRMTPEEINANWDAIQASMKGSKT